MNKINDYRRIYRSIIDALDMGKLSRRELIFAVVDAFGLSDEDRRDNSVNGRFFTLQSRIGAVINDMESKKIIGRESSGLYYRKEERAIAIRIEECEQILIELIESSARTRQEIKDELTAYFGTDTTTTVSDDNKLFTFICRYP